MKILLPVLLVTLALIGCDGDDVAVAPTATAPPPTTPTTVTLAQGTKTASASTILATVSVDESGILMGTITWSGAPATMAGGFMHVASSTVHGVTFNSGSPLTSAVTVTDSLVASGQDWQFAVGNSGPNVDVTYVVSFTPD